MCICGSFNLILCDFFLFSIHSMKCNIGSWFVQECEKSLCFLQFIFNEIQYYDVYLVVGVYAKVIRYDYLKVINIMMKHLCLVHGL